MKETRDEGGMESCRMRSESYEIWPPREEARLCSALPMWSAFRTGRKRAREETEIYSISELRDSIEAKPCECREIFIVETKSISIFRIIALIVNIISMF